jgi:UDP-2,3-diacylglucosamine pyrophosphatase LpxH
MISMSKKIVILSDIHIGDNSATCWYQKKYHEPYLIKALDYISQNAASIEEVILLGDIFDFWTYPCGSTPPSFRDIVNANPNILGPEGKLKQIAEKVPVTYVNGNHDMNVGQNDIATLGKIRYYNNLRYVRDVPPNGRVLFTHGSEYTMFNAQDATTALSPLPAGHFVTRAISEHLVKNKLTPGQTAADLPDNGTPSKTDLLPGIIDALENPQSIAKILLDAFTSLPGVSKDTVVHLLNGRVVTFRDAEKIYDNLGTQWVQKYGVLSAIKAAVADFNGNYIAWWAQRDALQWDNNAGSAVLGHTHTPKNGLREAMIDYANCGYMCPPLPGGNLQYPVTFAEYELLHGILTIMGTRSINDPYVPQPIPPDSLVYSPAEDYSCYISIFNNSKSTITNQGTKETHGYYIVPPPPRIGSHERGRFWMQDYPGAQGTEGSATYINQGSRKTITFQYACPLVLNNSCSPKPFENKSGNGSWVANEVVKRGHPYFVAFRVEE